MMKQTNRFLYSFAYLVLLGIPSVILTYLLIGEINIKALFIVLLITLSIGGVFDIWATRQGRNDKFFIWEYNPNSILGFKIYGVPVEDYIFFLFLTPVFIISIYEAAKDVSGSGSAFYKIIFLLIMVIVFFVLFCLSVCCKKEKVKFFNIKRKI